MSRYLPFFLTTYGSDALAIVVAVIIVVVTIVVIIFLGRDVIKDIKTDLEDRRFLREQKQAENDTNDADKSGLVAERKVISRRSKDLLALIDQDIYRSKEGNISVLFYMNLDNFRAISERFGTAKAGKVIEEIAAKIKKVGDNKKAISGAHESDILIYYLPGPVDNEVIEKYANDLLTAVNSPMKAIEEQVTTSIGIAIFPFDGITIQQLIKNAEIALYVAKKQGKNQFALYSSDLIEKEQFNINYYHEIKKSISNDEFLLYYQPIVDIKTGKLIGLESLLRWNHPTMGILSPGKFLNVMDLTGDITWFGTWGFEKIVQQYVAWKKTFRLKDMFISTNLSPKQLMTENLAKAFFDIVKKYHFDSESFCLEIIDYYTVIKNQTAVNNLSEFRRYGFRVAIDDLGDQYELAQDIERVHGNIIKICREDVMKIVNDFDEASKIDRVISAALKMQKVVIAEGIEDESMIQLMNAKGVRFLQGYYFSQPKSADETAQLFKKTPWSFEHLAEITK
ncbi:MAG: bifunctional diguanylate cyclase/phosphodiesterase [Candidatus Izemoplasmatales bacterium]|nr:bifunctional diguanylate cyclase/phosphodiesterase [Candidatus Izemoplasmatales bacterium]